MAQSTPASTSLAAHETKSDSEKQWDIDSFLSTKVVKESGCFITKFNVKWADKKTTLEPMETLFHCPLLFEIYEKKERKKLLKNLGNLSQNSNITETLGNFPAFPMSILQTFKDPAEYIPSGRETIMDIMKEGIRENGDTFWWVLFKNVFGICIVRKCLMEYYFPMASAFFHMEMRHGAKKHAAVVAANTTPNSS